MATHKVKGFNPKEQRLFDKLLDKEPYSNKQLKKLFLKDATKRCEEVWEEGWGEKEVDSQAQSYVRNSVRRLIRDGWVEQSARGTYRMSKKGITMVTKGVDVTISATVNNRGRKKKKVVEKEPKAAKIAKATKAKKSPKKAAKKTSKKVTKKANGVSAISTAKNAKEKVAKQAAVERAKRAYERAVQEMAQGNAN